MFDADKAQHKNTQSRTDFPRQQYCQDVYLQMQSMYIPILYIYLHHLDIIITHYTRDVIVIEHSINILI